MLRALIYFSKLSWAQNLISNWNFAWKNASRFIAGELQEDALIVVRDLNDQGNIATVDFLGEHTTNLQEASLAAAEVIRMLNAIGSKGLQANVSVKLSQIGLVLDKDACYENLRQILESARATNNFIRIDMEDSSLTTKTLDAIAGC